MALHISAVLFRFPNDLGRLRITFCIFCNWKPKYASIAQDCSKIPYTEGSWFRFIRREVLFCALEYFSTFRRSEELREQKRHEGAADNSQKRLKLWVSGDVLSLLCHNVPQRRSQK